MIQVYLSVALAFVVSVIGAVFYGKGKGKKQADLKNQVETKNNEIDESRKQEKLKDEVLSESQKANQQVNSGSDGDASSELQREYSRD